MAASDSAAMPRVDSAPPTMAAGAASTPKINCLEVENRANKRIGRTEPYSPCTAGIPEIWAYPMEIGMETAAMMMPEKISLGRYSFRYPRSVENRESFI